MQYRYQAASVKYFWPVSGGNDMVDMKTPTLVGTNKQNSNKSNLKMNSKEKENDNFYHPSSVALSDKSKSGK